MTSRQATVCKSVSGFSSANKSVILIIQKNGIPGEKPQVSLWFSPRDSVYLQYNF